MAEERLLDAVALANAGRWAYAYYVAGYAVECALKACVLARMVHTGNVFDEWKKGNPYRTHDFQELIHLAGLGDEFNARRASSSAAGDEFIKHWEIVSAWTETSRYEEMPEAEAKSLVIAIESNPDGVLKWLRNYW